MRKGERGAWAAAGVFFLLSAALYCVPGVRFSACLCAGIGLLSLIWLALNRLSEKSRGWKRIKTAFHWGVLLLAVTLVSIEGFILRVGHENFTALPADAVLVLGAGVNGTTPSVALQTRINAAADYLEAHPDIPVVLSGGQGPGESISEAEAMRRALESAGVERPYLLEEQSSNTAENFAFSRTLLAENGVDVTSSAVAVVTNDFHMARCQLIGERAGYDLLVGVPAELPWRWLSANYFAREAFAVIKTAIFD